MRPEVRSARRLLAGLASLLLLAASPSAGAAPEATTGQRLYLEGVLAYQVADYATAVVRLREALRSDPVEGLRKFRHSGLKEEDYLPHFYLGLALEKAGAPDAALAELRESERQGAVREKPGSYQLLRASLARLAPTPTPVPTAPRATPVPTRPSAPAIPTPRPEATAAPPAERMAARAPAAAPRGTSLPAVTGERRASLREGLRDFFRAEYGQAIVRLRPLAPDDPTARRFLAFSLAARWILDGRKDAGLLEHAREEYLAAAAAGPLVSPELVPEAVREALGAR